ncbi:hypothetical protein ACFLVW_06500 [Chloroflexota bacterium]
MKARIAWFVLSCLIILSLVAASCAPAEQATIFESIIITGDANKTSQPFRVTTKEWVANWSYVPHPEYPELAVFQLFIYPKGEPSMFVGFMLSPQGTSGSYSHAGAGEYYIKVVADNVESWEIVISPP